MQSRRTDRRGLGDVMFDLTSGRRRGHVIKNNEHTVIVEFISGCGDRVRIKRHKRKHDVRAVTTTFTDTLTDRFNDDVMWESGGRYVEDVE